MVEVTDLKYDPLENEGWERRSIHDEPRLSEVVKMYEEMGLEVLVISPEPDLKEGCKACVTGQPEKLKVVYTRKKVKEGG